MEKASEIGAKNGSVVGISLLSERLGDDNADVVDKRIDAPKLTYRLRTVQSNGRGV